MPNAAPPPEATVDEPLVCARDGHEPPRAREQQSGSIIVQDNVYLGQFVGLSRVYAHLALEIGSKRAFGLVAGSKGARPGIELLLERVLPVVRSETRQALAVVTDRGCEYAGPPAHPFERFLRDQDIQHCLAPANWPYLHAAFDDLVDRLKRDFVSRICTRRDQITIHEMDLRLQAWLESTGS